MLAASATAASGYSRVRLRQRQLRRLVLCVSVRSSLRPLTSTAAVAGGGFSFSVDDGGLRLHVGGGNSLPPS